MNEPARKWESFKTDTFYWNVRSSFEFERKNHLFKVKQHLRPWNCCWYVTYIIKDCLSFFHIDRHTDRWAHIYIYTQTHTHTYTNTPPEILKYS